MTEDRTRLLDDRTLVGRLRAGDDAAFATLVRDLDGLLRRLARGVVRSEALIDDVVQDTWIGVIRGIGTFEERSTLRTWICRILLNRARTAAVKAGRTVPVSARAEEGEDDAAILDRFTAAGEWARPLAAWPEERPDVLAARAELVAAVTEAIETLPERQRQVVLLRDVHDWTAEEVCNALELAETNQRVLLHRGRAKIRIAVEAAMARTPTPRRPPIP